MECSIKNLNENDKINILNNHFYKNVKDINVDNILEFNVKKISEEKILEAHLKTVVDNIYEICVIYQKDVAFVF